jgi:phosphatidylserine/phosphatidylglycerophosphate/cardiolipin synthase-like enzyme
MENAGVPVLIDDKHAIAHSKVITIDGQTLITGSFNFTESAEQKNAENLLIIKDAPTLLNAYAANFQAHAAHAKRYERKAGTPSPETPNMDN